MKELVDTEEYLPISTKLSRESLATTIRLGKVQTVQTQAKILLTFPSAVTNFMTKMIPLHLERRFALGLPHFLFIP